MASLHLDFALHNAAIQEVIWPFAPEIDALFDGDLTIEHGHALPPTAPGLGIVLDEAAARALESAGPAAPPELLRYADGAPAEVLRCRRRSHTASTTTSCCLSEPAVPTRRSRW